MQIDRIDADDAAAVEEWYQLHCLVDAADLPDFPTPARREVVGRLHYPWPGKVVEFWVARVDGHIVGSVSVDLPQLDNTSNAMIELQVDPAYRRRGIGRALYERTVERARLASRKRIMADSVDTLPGGPRRPVAGTAFAESLGAKRAMDEVRRRLDLKTVDEAGLDDQLAEAWPRAAGYSLVQWRDVAPADVIVDLAALDSQFLAEAPTGDLDLEPENVDAARFRASERVAQARGRRGYHTAARHDATGQVVAWTLIQFDEEPPDHAWQQITLVHPEHRGHRLGVVTKIENLAYARLYERELRMIDTWNASVNTHMIAINEAMGFRPVDTWPSWQIEI